MPFTINTVNSKTKEKTMKITIQSKGQQSVSASALQDAYAEFFREKLEQYGVSSPAELDTENTSKFFTEIKDEWPVRKASVK